MNISSKRLNLIPQKIAFNATAKRGYDILFLLCFSCTFFERAFQLRSKFRCSSIIINISSAFVGSCKSKKMYTHTRIVWKYETFSVEKVWKRRDTLSTRWKQQNREKSESERERAQFKTKLWRKWCFCLDLDEDLNEFIIEIYSSACIVYETHIMHNGDTFYISAKTHNSNTKWQQKPRQQWQQQHAYRTMYFIHSSRLLVFFYYSSLFVCCHNTFVLCMYV